MGAKAMRGSGHPPLKNLSLKEENERGNCNAVEKLDRKTVLSRESRGAAKGSLKLSGCGIGE